MVINLFNYFSSFNPIFLAFLGGIFSFVFTILGASIVFFFKRVNTRLMNAMLSISAGVMTAASFFSLINPAVDICQKYNQSFFITVVFGFICGSFFIYLGNIIFDKIKIFTKSTIKKCLILFASITLHNIPEGIAIGVAFGNILYGSSLIAAFSLTLGIAIQNFPEGSAISLPLRRYGVSRTKSFAFSILSGIVEPIFAVIGALLVLKINYILSFILSFAASAMLYVTVIELIPESQLDEKKDLMALLFIFGFIIMMILDVMLG